jgi:superfamily II DNA or RNA helicase
LKGQSRGLQLQLWEFQKQIVEEALNKRNVVIVLPQGTGKTVIGLSLVKEGNFKKVVILVHRKNLINSWIERADEWLPGRLFVVDSAMSEVEKREIYNSKKIVLTTIQLFRNNLKKCLVYLSAFDLIMIDECAETVAKYSGGYRKNVFYEILGRAKHAKIIGLMPPFMRRRRLDSVTQALGANIISVPFSSVKDFIPEYKTSIIEVYDPIVSRVDKVLGYKIRRLYSLVYKGCRECGLNVTREGVYRLKEKELERLDERTQKSFWKLRNVLAFKQKLLYGNKIRLRDSRLYTHPEGRDWIDSPDKKIEKLAELLKTRVKDRVLIFCEFKEIVKHLKKELEQRGVFSTIITGDVLRREKRKQIMDRFRFGDSYVLIATDVLDAGVDIPQGDAVVHYTFSWDSYKHRQKNERIRGGEQIFIIYANSSEVKKVESLLKEVRKIQSKFVVGGID